MTIFLFSFTRKVGFLRKKREPRGNQLPELSMLELREHGLALKKNYVNTD
jgi:hypothetical protein